MGLRDLNVDLTKEHVAFYNETKKFFSKVWRPAAIELDALANPEDVIAKDSVLWDVIRQTYELEYHSAAFRTEVGGLDSDPLTVSLMLELMGWAAPDLAISLGVATTPFSWAMLSPEPEMQDLAKAFCADRKGEYIGCWCITEPDRGSDSLRYDGRYAKMPEVAYQVQAVKDGDDYILNGQKSAWVSNGTIATHAAVWLSLDPSRGNEGGGIAIIPLNLRGITRGKPLNKMGQRALNQGEIFFNNVRIPKRMMIASDPETYKSFSQMQLAIANAAMGGYFTGCAQAAFEEALEYSRNRKQGGKPIFDHQNIRLKLSDMFISVEASRSLARRVWLYNTTLYNQMQPLATHYAMASKVLSTQTAFKVASEAIQVFGGYGLCKEYHVEKLFRDARAALIEDGTNETLALEAMDLVVKGKTVWNVKEGLAPVAAGNNGEGPSFEDLKPMLRPEGVHFGIMKIDAEKCTKCGLCVQNCPFKCMELSADKVPVWKKNHTCFSCFNCMVVCKAGAISPQRAYQTDETCFFTTDPTPELAPPLPPKGADGKEDQWNTVEQTIMERRSVRNYKDKPVPEPLIQRVLEAGRFAPSAGNNQPWKFAVVTDPAFLQELEAKASSTVSMTYSVFKSDALVMSLVQMLGPAMTEGLFDPRPWAGALCVVDKELPVFFGAPAVIFLGGNDRLLTPALQIGIAGQNMSLAAHAMGLGTCWSGFGAFLDMVPEVKEKLGFEAPWRIYGTLALGYPKFKQSGIVERQNRPVTWFRPNSQGE